MEVVGNPGRVSERKRTEGIGGVGVGDSLTRQLGNHIQGRKERGRERSGAEQRWR